VIRITVVPGRLAGRVASLAGGWEVVAAPVTAGDLGAALCTSAQGDMVLFVASEARLPDRLANILVPHDGSPGTALALEAADQLAAGGRAEVVVLHVPGAEVPAEPGSLPAPRMVDHVAYDLPDWREEFGRRFFQRSPGLLRRLEVRVGPVPESILAAARALPADLIVLGWRGVADQGRAVTLRTVCDSAPCPVLLAASPGAGPRARDAAAGATALYS
jgi:nucleotide-binding universal stress UspA family protein